LVGPGIDIQEFVLAKPNLHVLMRNEPMDDGELKFNIRILEKAALYKHYADEIVQGGTM